MQKLTPLQKYDIAYRHPAYSEYSPGFHFAAKVRSKVEFKSVLDVGCGTGAALLYFLLRGKVAKGIDPCQYLLATALRGFALNSLATYGTIQQIPCKDELVDLVFCADVLEHVPEEESEKAVSELVRVSKRYIAVSIALFPSRFLGLGLHENVKSSDWWLHLFTKFGLKCVWSERQLLKGKPSEEGGMEAIYEKV